MNPNPAAIITPEVRSLIEAVCDGKAGDVELHGLQSLLRTNEEACNFYVDLLNLDAELQWLIGSRREGNVALTDFIAAKQTTSHPPVFPSLFHNSLTYLSSGWPVAYLIATVILGIGMLIGTFTYVSQPVQVASKSPVVTRGYVASEPQREFVGQITGMVDCKWADPSKVPVSGRVAMGQKIAIASGLMKITYDTGAKVILQGPVTYEVESKNGGFLSIGKLTGKVEAEKAKGFSVRTPTAVVTDLGTEFGVEVSKEGSTMSHVFRGAVRVHVANDGKTDRADHVLHENESAHVEASGNQGGKCIKILDPSDKPTNFVREIPKPTIKTLDLVDVVAGGDGFSGRRGRGIDPRSGRTSDTMNAPKATSDYFVGDQKYHRAETLPLVDGVFIPDGRSGPVQIDSAGHAFDGFGATSNWAAGHVWAMDANPIANPRTELDGVEYGSADHALLYLSANNGVTFDLDAIRRANPGCKLLRFRAMAGNTETASEKGENVSADVWVLIDGQMRFRRCWINGNSGVFWVVVPLGEKDRFLTLASTDGGNGIDCDWIMFGDPRLELAAREAASNFHATGQ